MKIDTTPKAIEFDTKKHKYLIVDDVTFNHKMSDAQGLSVSFIIVTEQHRTTTPLVCSLPNISAENALRLKYDIYKTFVFIDNKINNKVELANILSLQCQIVVQSLLPDWEAELKFHFA